MALAAKTLCMVLNPEVMSEKRRVQLGSRILSFRKPWPCKYISLPAQENIRRSKIHCATQAPAARPESCNDLMISLNDFAVTIKNSENGEMKLVLDISGAKTQAIFDDVFTRLVNAAQPIPGFRRMKGGKTPDIPKHILLHIIGPSKVNKEAIKKIINTTIAEYVSKEGLRVTKDLKVEQTFEEMEAAFQPGKDFSFDAVLQLQAPGTT